MNIGRRIYYDLSTGNVLQDTGERSGGVVPTSIEGDFKSYNAIKERVPSTVGIIELEFGELLEDFMSASSYSIDLKTKSLVFSYPDPSLPGVEQPLQRPLTEQMVELEASYMYDSMMKDLAIEELTNNQAELMYQLMMNGVI